MTTKLRTAKNSNPKVEAPEVAVVTAGVETELVGVEVGADDGEVLTVVVVVNVVGWLTENTKTTILPFPIASEA